jgi:hypothetical protein
MGRLLQVGSMTYVAELGNVPNPEFSSLLGEGHGQFQSMEQQRLMTARYDNPERHTRGLEPAFTEKGNLFMFAELFNKDLFKTGSTVPAHLPNPQDRTKPQLNVLQLHALFLNLLEARKLAEEQYKKFDEYDARTDTENIERLQNSLEPSLKEAIDSLTPEEEKNKMFAIYWLRVVDVVQKHTMEYLQGIQEQVKTLLPQAFPGENIKEFRVAILALAKPLTNAGKYPQELTLSVITNLLTGGGDAGHVGRTLFQADIMLFRHAIQEKLATLGLQLDPDKDTEMKLAHLGLIDLIGKATASYSARIQEK